MSDRMKILTQLKRQKQKPPLQCTASSTCWCANVSYRFPMVVIDECMSPQEMLERGGDDLCTQDVKYLKSLSDRDFIA
jgi:hypothetical protein